MAKRLQLVDNENNRPAAKRVRQKLDNYDVLSVRAKTEGQQKMIDSFKNGYNIVAEGSAGTGKSYIATFLALQELFDKSVDKILIVRSAVNIRSQGFLPGTLDEKEMVYTIPYKNIVDQICQNGTAWETLTKKGMIEFISTTYIRGRTLDNCIVIVDEFQNMDESECESVLTRLGENCQVILCGDTRQNDLKRKREVSCYEWLLKLTNKLPEHFVVVQFNIDDIVRSELCKAIITAIETL